MKEDPKINEQQEVETEEKTPLQVYCDENPSSEECKIYDV